MLFNYQLCPFIKLPPWGMAGDLSLHWHALSYGVYWIDAGDIEILRYSPRLGESVGKEVSQCTLAAGHAVRSLSRCSALERCDRNAAHCLAADATGAVPSTRPQRVVDKLAAKCRHGAAEMPGASLALEGARNILYEASRWGGKQSLDTAYLQAGAEIAFWSDGTDVHIQWDNRSLMLEGLPVWDAQFGEHRMPMAEFIHELRAFDARFIRRMQDRMALVPAPVN